jgi:hypothetical protein
MTVTAAPLRRFLRAGARRPDGRPAVDAVAVASFPSHAAAARTVDLLGGYTFPVHRLSLVGAGTPRRGLLGQVADRFGWAERAGAAAGTCDLYVDAAVAAGAWRLLMRLRPADMTLLELSERERPVAPHLS